MKATLAAGSDTNPHDEAVGARIVYECCGLVQMTEIDTTTAVIALLVLALVFVIGTVSKLQMGIAAIVAATIVGPLVFGESVQEIQQGRGFGHRQGAFVRRAVGPGTRPG